MRRSGVRLGKGENHPIGSPQSTGKKSSGTSPCARLKGIAVRHWVYAAKRAGVERAALPFGSAIPLLRQRWPERQASHPQAISTNNDDGALVELGLQTGKVCQ